MNESLIPLSKSGGNRREAILRRALEEARRRRWRRIGQRLVVACLVVGLMGVEFWHLRSDKGGSVEFVKKEMSPAAPRETERAVVVVSRIETDPDIVRRLRLPEQALHVEMIQDQQLLAELAAAHEPAGLAYVDGKAVLMFR
jgi:hypothetical protein